MLYYLLYPLREWFFGFNVFKYITFRATMASITAFLISIIFGPMIIKKLKSLGVTEHNEKNGRELLCKFNKNKLNTPTMGGLLIILAVLGATLLWSNITNKYIIICIISTLWLGFIGFIDDLLKLKNSKSDGIKIKPKLIGQILLGLVIGGILYMDPSVTTRLDVPFVKNLLLYLGIFYIPFIIIVIVASSNAVNITDGLDGLAVGCVVIAAIAYAVMSYVSGNIKFCDYLNVVYIAGSGELTIFCAAIVGAGLGFLWYNAYPADIFMGDTGALALGGAIGTVAILIKKELLLFIVGAIFVFEALSVIIQVGFFKWKKRRIFLMAPIHHHFQQRNWAEPKIVIRFWIVAIIFALFSIATLKLR